MIRRFIELVTGNGDHKRRYRAYKTRIARLPKGYRNAAEAIERYFTNVGGVTNGAALVTMLEDLADLLEQSAAQGANIREVVGDAPVEFADDFLRNYVPCQWNDREKERLTRDIARAAGAGEELQ